MPHKVGPVLIDAEAIARCVRAVGAELADAYADREPVVVAVMKGCVLFLADLVRAWPGPMDLEFVTATSYRGTQAGEVRLTVPDGLAVRVAGRPTVVVDAVFDTGATLAAVCRALGEMGADEVRSVVLLRKRRLGVAPPDFEPDWVGFEIEDRFVVGYGLDLGGRYRNLPHVAALQEG